MLELKKTVIRTSAAIFLTVAGISSAYASPVMTINCDEPNGQRTDFYAGELEESDDGFVGVKPKIIFDDKKPQLATVLFEPAGIVEKLGLKSTSSFKIMVQTTEQITITASTDKNITQMYTFFPKQGIGYFTLHAYNTSIRDGEASTVTLIAKCKFGAK